MDLRQQRSRILEFVDYVVAIANSIRRKSGFGKGNRDGVGGLGAGWLKGGKADLDGASCNPQRCKRWDDLEGEGCTLPVLNEHNEENGKE